jgi:hypothetical protein
MLVSISPPSGAAWTVVQLSQQLDLALVAVVEVDVKFDILREARQREIVRSRRAWTAGRQRA